MKFKRYFLILFFSLWGASSAWAQEDVPRFGYEVVNTYPHDINAFTQGLVFRDGYLFEGTGKNGQSSLSKVNLDDGRVMQSTSLNRRYFGEGIEVLGDKIYQLTWRSNMVFMYDKHSFEPIGNHYNASEGWGLAFDGDHLIMSDGTATLQFMNPETFTPERKVEVTLNGNPIIYLNELEYINGEVWANVWQTNYILRINPETGDVVSIVDMTGLSQQTKLGSSEAVLNGIAWDEAGQRLFVTGKNWSNLFEIELVDP